MNTHRLGGCLLFLLATLVSCGDDDPASPSVDGEAIGADGGWVTAPGVAMLGVPPLMLSRPQEFAIDEAVDAPALPDHYEPVVVVHVEPDAGEYAAPLWLLALTGAAWGPRYDLLRHDGDAWQVVDGILVHAWLDGAMRVGGWTTRLGLLAIARNTLPIEGVRAKIRIYEQARVGPTGEIEPHRQHVFTDFRDGNWEQVQPRAVQVGGVELGDDGPGFGADLPSGTFAPGSEVAVEVVGGDAMADLEASLTIPASVTRITSHVGGQTISRDEVLVLEWAGATSGFVTVFVGSGELRERFEVPDSGRLSIGVATLTGWVEGHDDLSLIISRLTRRRVRPDGWAAVDLEYLGESRVDLVLR